MKLCIRQCHNQNEIRMGKYWISETPVIVSQCFITSNPYNKTVQFGLFMYGAVTLGTTFPEIVATKSVCA